MKDPSKNSPYFSIRKQFIHPHGGVLFVCPSPGPPDGSAATTTSCRLLVQAIAQERLGCRRIHVIRPAALLAKYGIHADAALATVVHQIVLSAAFAGAACTVGNDANHGNGGDVPVCIILDQLHALVPPPPHLPGSIKTGTSTTSSTIRPRHDNAGDAALPVLQGIAFYLNRLIRHLQPAAATPYSITGSSFSTFLQQQQQNRSVPFPIKNQLYNLGGVSSGDGYVLPVTLYFIGILNDDASSHSLLTGIATAHNVVRLPPTIIPRNSSPWLNVPSSGSANFTLASQRDGQAAVRAIPIPSASSSADRMIMDRFPSVGGNQDAKDALEDALALDPRRRQILHSMGGLSPPTGILLYGAPGTGKTLLARGVAHLMRQKQLQQPQRSWWSASTNKQWASRPTTNAFIAINSTDIVRAEVGTGEKMVAAAFETARANAPSVVFVDEFQALFSARGGGHSSSRITSTLLQCMDDTHQWRRFHPRTVDVTDVNGPPDRDEGNNHNDDTRIVVLGATNTPWMVDRAFLRPGRFDRVVHVSLPNQEDRKSILRLYISNMKTDLATDAALNEAYCELANATAGFSGADLAGLCRSAAIQCLVQGGTNEHVSLSHFRAAVQSRSDPSSAAGLVQKIEKWHP